MTTIDYEQHCVWCEADLSGLVRLVEREVWSVSRAGLCVLAGNYEGIGEQE
jgi:hypothetical protein